MDIHSTSMVFKKSQFVKLIFAFISSAHADQSLWHSAEPFSDTTSDTASEENSDLNFNEERISEFVLKDTQTNPGSHVKNNPLDETVSISDAEAPTLTRAQRGSELEWEIHTKLGLPFHVFNFYNPSPNKNNEIEIVHAINRKIDGVSQIIAVISLKDQSAHFLIPGYFTKNINLKSTPRAPVWIPERIIKTTISTGRSGYATKKGVYTVINIDIDHKSTNTKFEGAPMNFFQRLGSNGDGDDFGFHEGNVSSPFQSHGCVRLPRAIASELYFLSKNIFKPYSNQLVRKWNKSNSKYLINEYGMYEYELQEVRPIVAFIVDKFSYPESQKLSDAEPKIKKKKSKRY